MAQVLCGEQGIATGFHAQRMARNFFMARQVLKIRFRMRRVAMSSHRTAERTSTVQRIDIRHFHDYYLKKKEGTGIEF